MSSYDRLDGRTQNVFVKDDEIRVLESRYGRTRNMLAVVSGIVICVIIIILLPYFFAASYVKYDEPNVGGLYSNLYDMITSDDGAGAPNSTIYGAAIQSWQLDTSREYHLSRFGKWNSDVPPTTREYNFTISEVEDTYPAGVKKTMTLINGKFPGPLIQANEGDRIIINFLNNASTSSALHFHGLHQNGTNYMDGAEGITQCGIAPGKSFTYNFTLDNIWGTYWYHSHYSTQYLEGVFGPVVIHSKKEDEKYKDLYDEEMVILLSDLYFENSYDLIQSYIAPDVENAEPIPDSGLIQGKNYFDCTRLEPSGNYSCKNTSDYAIIPVLEDKTYRLRIISAGGFSEFDFSIDNHILQVVEADGVNTEPLPIEALRLANAQRYSVLVTMNQTSVSAGHWLRASMNTHCYDGENPHLDPELRAILSYPEMTRLTIANDGVPPSLPETPKSHQLDGTVKCLELNETLLIPSFPLVAPEPDTLIHLDASFMIGAHQISLGYFNSSTYKKHASNYSTLNEIYNSIDRGQISQIFSDSSVTPEWANGDMVVTIDKPMVVDLLINNYDDG
ncbi:ferroxidase FET3 [Sugiyamaella lignohabitans]|uniref:Ferroxidase FET3 n=1 Tax=Sugiyamaella lignohabitans TaxID=796027 RepID=A0A161HF49_9ASCO|nr:ferroxidase FET3 [Sugiyamaella lignohabitans]ANB14070.1 ferroxidase FET3 [Sugiyamaella lignohabitans]